MGRRLPEARGPHSRLLHPAHRQAASFQIRHGAARRGARVQDQAAVCGRGAEGAVR